MGDMGEDIEGSAGKAAGYAQLSQPGDQPVPPGPELCDHSRYLILRPLQCRHPRPLHKGGSLGYGVR